MNVYNNTSIDLYYDITSTSSGDCGNLGAGQTAEWPGYDNSQGVVVSFVAMPDAGPNPTPFSVSIPTTGVGGVVTIGLYLE
jgi:hypothetical protein